MKFFFSTAGESHGKALVAIIEGLPSGLQVSIEKINYQLWRRQQGYGRGARMKIESDRVEILSGVRHGKTLGSPVALLIENKDFVHWTDVMAVEKSEKDIEKKRAVKSPRPGHADLAGGLKFQTKDLRDILERASARETAARVAVGAIAKQLLEEFNIQICSHVIKLGNIPEKPLQKSWEEIYQITDSSPLRCADKHLEEQMIKLIEKAKQEGDTLGGVFEVVAKGVPAGLGSHTSWRERLDGQIAQAFMSIQAVKAVEIGEGVENASKFGSQVHDEIFYENGQFKRLTNRAGGLEGGITNGEEIRVRGYMKPISTLRKTLRSVDIDTKMPKASAFERSDVTAVPAAGVIGEAMLAIVLANAMREKFGGDSLKEMKRNFQGYIKDIENY
ncbi:MAG: chorismate synthase [Pyrinomonadaceae bacterium]|nr:chorismate synthase [Pyrinomonadaceae bacterium]MCX7639017.1 chorismate synthase [Pyrinomonadaceae bacterium]MDW8303763.1 chorismate synthase [Acidobacteriota bacterium]